MRLWAIAVSMLCIAPLAWSADQAGPMPKKDPQPPTPQRHQEFVVPPRLEGRVAFWKDIFSRYGQHQAVLHHREYPQVTFGVVDLRAEALLFSGVLLERERKRRVESLTAEIYDDLTLLARGQPPQTPRQQAIADSMAFIPGGAHKYRRMLEDKLVRSQTGIREKWEAAIERSGRYLYLIEKIFRNDFHLPLELTRLPFVESSFDYRANSSVGAAGIWQFMPRTGRIYLMINKAVDERRDPIRATEAAAKYLRSAHDRLGTWPLAVTSYNHGVGGVAKAVRVTGTTSITSLIESHTDRPFGFASSNFFPSLLAAIECYEQRQQLYPGVMPEPGLKLASIKLTKPAPISWVVQRTGVPAERLRELNYGILEPVWQGRLPIPQGYELKVPLVNADRLSLLLGAPPKMAAPPAIKAPIKGKSPVKRSAAKPGSQKKSVAAPSKTSSYRVRKGDTLDGIAKRFGVTVAQLRALNAVSGSSIRAGQILKIPKR